MRKEVKEHLLNQLGKSGARAVEFIESGEKLISACLGKYSIRDGEVLSYCLRETFMSIVQSYETLENESNKRNLDSLKGVFENYRHAKIVDDEKAKFLLGDLEDELEKYFKVLDDKITNRIRLGYIFVQQTGAKNFSDSGLKQFIKLLNTSNEGLHNSVTLKDAVHNWDSGMALLEKLFMPPQLRSETLVNLAKIPNPNEEDVASLKLLSISPMHASSFMREVDSFRWVDQIANDPDLRGIPEDFSWPFMELIEKFRLEFSTELITILKKFSFYEEFKGRGELIEASRRLLPESEQLIIDILSSDPDNSSYIFASLRALEDISPGSEAVNQLASILLMNKQENIYLATRAISEKMTIGVSSENLGTRLQIISKAVSNRQNKNTNYSFLRIKPQGSIGENIGLYFIDELEDLMKLLMTLLVVESNNLSCSEVFLKIAELPLDIQDRVRSWYLTTAQEVDVNDIHDEINRSIKSRYPTGDDVKLVDRLRKLESDESFSTFVKEIFGEAPMSNEYSVTTSNPEISNKIAWLQLFSGSIVEDWIDFVENTPSLNLWMSSDELLTMNEPTMKFGGSPYSVDELEEISKFQACKKIQSWRPSPYEFLVSPRELGRTLEVLVSKHPDIWLEKPFETFQELYHPTYIQHYLNAALSLMRENILMNPGEWVYAVQKLLSNSWKVEQLGPQDPYSYDSDWSSVIDTAIQLLKLFLEKDAVRIDDLDFIRNLFLEVSGNFQNESSVTTSDGDSLLLAINRSNTKATEAVFSLIDFEYRKLEKIKQIYFEHFEILLEQEGSLGLQIRAILAPRYAYLRKVNSEWFNSNLSLFFGRNLPDDLRNQTIRLVIKWSSVADNWFLQNMKADIYLAAYDGVHNALEHISLAMIWKRRGYSVMEVIQELQNHPRFFSDFARTLANVTRSDQVQKKYIDVVVSFWKETLELERPNPEIFFGFGWMAEIKQLDGNEWEYLTQLTLEKCRGKIDWKHGVVERILTQDVNPRQFRILADLLIAPDEIWGKHEICTAGVSRLESGSEYRDHSDFIRLKNLLRERGYEIQE